MEFEFPKYLQHRKIPANPNNIAFKKLNENSRVNYHGEQAKKKLDYYFESLKAINNLHKQINHQNPLSVITDLNKNTKPIAMQTINQSNYRDYFDSNFQNKCKRKRSALNGLEERFSRKRIANTSNSSRAFSPSSPFSKPYSFNKLDLFSSNFKKNKLLINFNLYS